jgi:hypothetical protein
MSIETTIHGSRGADGRRPRRREPCAVIVTGRLPEYICEENNRNFVDANGKAGIRLENPSKK